MNAKQKRQFVRALIRGTQKAILAKVSQMPPEWDGHELRAYIADQFEANKVTVGRRDAYGRAYRQRTAEYRNECITRNL